MSESILIADIESWLRSHALGHAKARPRRELLAYLCAQGHWPTPNDTADRAMRKACETMEQVGSCSRGYFWIVNAEDRRIARGQLIAPARSMFEREKKIGAVDARQGELF
jgi:hypothetical protein